MTVVNDMETGSGNGDGAKPITGRTVLYWLIGFFAVIFTANAVFVWLALGSFPGEVKEGSYKVGQKYNQEIAAARAQSQLGWSVTADLARGSGSAADLVVTAADAEGSPLTGLTFSAILEHPTNDAGDTKIALQEIESGRYAGSAEMVTSGNWNLVILAENADGRVFKSENRLYLSE